MIGLALELSQFSISKGRTVSNYFKKTLMKNLATLTFALLSLSLFSQDPWVVYDMQFILSFDDPSQFSGIDIDTISNPNNSWQVGAPQKSLFTSALTPPNVIVTDTINPYLINDTSIFSLTFLAGPGFTNPDNVK